VKQIQLEDCSHIITQHQITWNN